MSDFRGTRKWREVRARIVERDQVCAVCGTDEQLEVDHIYPVSKGGDHYDPDNLQVLCRYHNRQKSDNTEGQTHDYINPRWIEWAGK